MGKIKMKSQCSPIEENKTCIWLSWKEDIFKYLTKGGKFS